MPLTYLSVLNLPPPSSKSTRLGLSPIVLWELCMLPTCQISDFHRGCSLSPLSVCTSHANTFLCSPGLRAFPLSFSYSASCLRWLIRPPCCFTWAISVARAGSGWRHCDRWVKLLYLDSFAAPYCLPVFVFLLFFPTKPAGSLDVQRFFTFILLLFVCMDLLNTFTCTCTAILYFQKVHAARTWILIHSGGVNACLDEQQRLQCMRNAPQNTCTAKCSRLDLKVKCSCFSFCL